jgi:hypothetical protein
MLSGVASLATDDTGYCAVLTSGGVDCWGTGNYGQLGDGIFYTTGNDGSATPVQVLGLGGTGTLSGAASLASDYNRYCAVLTSGSVDCWGYGYDGELGNGIFYTTGNRGSATPVQVSVVVPVVTTNPVTQSAVTGGTLTFTAGATGTPTPTVQWQVSVDGGKTWLNIEGATSTSYTTGALLPFVTGWELRAVFTNSGGSATTNAATITVTPATSVLIPGNGAMLSGSAVLDATASAGVSSVFYEITGGSLSQAVIASGTATLYGWLARWDSTSVPNGTYTLQSVASYANGVSGTSAGVTITVNNAPPNTFVALPANNATLLGHQWLDAVASPGVASVNYVISGGPNNLVDTLISGSALTIYGWIGGWTSTTVPNGTYTVQSVASYAGGVTGTSAPITVTVAN